LKTIFGPINSRRFGKSLGVDLSPNTKQCNFDCLYCELKPAKVVDAQNTILPIEQIVNDIQNALKEFKDIDVLTITANGEPTLYPHLSELMDAINKIKGTTKTLILSNASTIAQKEIQKALLKFDSVKLSLDCATQNCFRKLDRPSKSISLDAIKEGMLAFKKIYRGELIIEILFVEGINDNLKEVAQLNQFLLKLKPSRIDIGTIDRPPAYNIKALAYDKLRKLSLAFDASLPVVITAKAPQKGLQYNYTTEDLLHTLSRRPLTNADIETLFNKASQERFYKLLNEGKIIPEESSGIIFYRTKESECSNP